jgi:hypothetical protein
MSNNGKVKFSQMTSQDSIDDSASAFITVLDQTRPVNNITGGRDVAFFDININTALDQNDYIKLQVANQTSTDNVTAEDYSYYIIEER